jgi:succinate dehydrogenase/fumarate reductase flavoprotein subunit
MAAAETVSCDVLVIGSGAGGLAAAVTAGKLGLDVLVVEKEPWLGGTTALSGGWLWIPCNPLAQRAGVEDSLDAARNYLSHELGNRYDESRVSAFLENGPRMVSFFERETSVKFFLGATYPDYHPDAPGGRSGGRGICAESYDGRELRARIEEIRPPVPELTLFGIKVGAGTDFRHFANAQRSLRSALYVLGRIAVHLRDVVIHGRDLRLMNGNALIGRLVRSAYDLNIRLWRSCPAQELLRADERIVGAMVLRKGKQTQILARRGVILACGGFSKDAGRRQQLLGHYDLGGTQDSLAAPGNTGDGLRMAERVGASLSQTVANAAAWMPVSRPPRRDGSLGVYPHSFDRGKPGIIAVGRDGRRFVNESNSYHDVGAAMISAGRREPAAFLLGDHRSVRRYGLGMAKPFPIPLGSYLRSGYLIRGRTLAEVALKAGIDAVSLEDTVRAYNRAASRGEDPDFKRGGNAYNRYNGDADHAPNPCLAPIEKPPFYIVAIHVGDLSTFSGVKIDNYARVLDQKGAPIAGLYACGADTESIFGGNYPGPGINIGPAMTFGYIAALHLAGR